MHFHAWLFRAWTRQVLLQSPLETNEKTLHIFGIFGRPQSNPELWSTWLAASLRLTGSDAEIL